MKSRFFNIIAIVLLVGSCNQVFENDIENEKVTITSPRTYSDGTTVDILASTFYTFKWDKITGAEEYRLQIDIIDSTGGQAFYNNVWDTIVSDDQARVDISTALIQNGRFYRFGVRAQNSAYNSNFSYVNFYRSNVVDISEKTVTLSRPEKDATVNSLTVTFTWEELDGGNFDRYLFERLNSSGSVLSRDTLSSTTITKTLPDYKREYWRVRAQNEISTTLSQSPTWSFVIDDTTSSN